MKDDIVWAGSLPSKPEPPQLDQLLAKLEKGDRTKLFLEPTPLPRGPYGTVMAPTMTEAQNAYQHALRSLMQQQALMQGVGSQADQIRAQIARSMGISNA